MKPKIIALILIVAAGAFVRLSNLGKFGFWNDEFYHVYAAKSYLAQGTFAVPFDTEEYRRALPVTLITALSFKVFGESEFAARLPFAVVNLIFIVCAYVALSRIMTPFVGLAFAFIMAFAPLAIEMSRECRMYTLLQFFYFFMALAFIEGFEEDDRGLLTASWIFGMLAVSVQVMAFNFGFVVLVYAGVMLAVNFRRRYLAVPVAAVLFTALLLIFKMDFVWKLADFALTVPEWSRHMTWQYYRYLFADGYPMLCAAFPLGAWWMVDRYGRKGLFWTLSFIIPMALHAFLYGPKSDRYIFYVFPFFVLAAANGIECIKDALWGYSGWKQIAVACLILGFCLPWLPAAFKVRNEAKFPNWKPGNYEARVREGFQINKYANLYYYGGAK